MRARLLRTCLGMVVLLLLSSGCGLLKDGAYDLPLPGGPDAGPHPRTVTVHFTSVDGLVPKSMVKVGNVAVGEVKSIDVDPKTWTASVRLTVRGDVDLPANAVAQVRRSSLLGEWFVQLSPPASGRSDRPLASGAAIPIARTTETAPVEEILGALSLLLNDGGVPQLNQIVHELNRAFGGRAPQVRALLTQLDSFTGHLDAHKGDIVRALDGLDRLSRTLAANKTDIAAALDKLPAGVKVLADQRGQLVTMLRSLRGLSRVAVRVVDRSKTDTIADLAALRPTLTKLAEAGSDLPEALRLLVTFPFPPGASDATLGDYVNLNNDVDLDLDTLLSDLLRGLPQAPAGLPDPSSILKRGSSSDPDPGSATGTTSKSAPPASSSGSPGSPPSGAGSADGGGLSGLLTALGLGGKHR